ncbi:hypothetical protein AAHA92_21053 [Salvia divinorum]|uniref:Uncharacterized protein n=1 Tax=Salvia divinorum TaxID=28513 RepID=A0ABD1GMM3_SALDI
MPTIAAATAPSPLSRFSVVVSQPLAPVPDSSAAVNALLFFGSPSRCTRVVTETAVLSPRDHGSRLERLEQQKSRPFLLPFYDFLIYIRMEASSKTLESLS